MAISLGSLFIDLKVNLAEFLSGMTKAQASAKATGRGIETALGKVGDMITPLGAVGQRIASVLDMVGASTRSAFAEIGRSQMLRVGLEGLGGGVAALGGTLFALAEKASEVGSRIYDASVKTGISAAQMSGLSAIAKETGGNFDSLTTSLARAGANLQSGIIDPGGKVGKTLSQVMGGATQLSELGLKPMGDRLQDVLQHIFNLTNVGERNVALSALLGRGWMQNVETLRVLAEQGYAPAIAQARKFGEFFDDNSARQAKQFKVELADINGTLAGLALTLGQKVVPALTDFMVKVVGVQAFQAKLVEGVSPLWGPLKMSAAVAENYGAAMKAANQAMTDFRVHSDNLTAGEKASSEETDKLSKGLKGHGDALADLITRERDELSALNSNNNVKREATLEYERSVTAIQKAVDAGGSYKESLVAQALALDVYNRKLDLYNEKILQGTKVSIPSNLPWLGGPRPAPALAVPSMPANLLTGAAIPKETLSQLAQLAGQTDSTRGLMRALREETELSATSFKKLAAAFPGLTEQEVSSTAAGRALIEQLTKMDRLGSLGDQFKSLKDTLILEGDELGTHLTQTLGHAIEGIEDSLAKLVVTGRGNFKQLAQGIEESLVKAGIQKVVGAGVGAIGNLLGVDLGGFGKGKPDGSKSNAFYVIPVDQGGGLLKSAAGSEADSGGGGGSFLGSIGSFFGGFLQAGGDVTPGHAYIVGEKHPEWFIPKVAGHVASSVGAQQLRSQAVYITNHITTPDADSFRRSQSQIISDAYRHAALAHARHS